MFDFLDFNGNGELDPMELCIGASIVGGIGCGAGLSAEEERENDLRDEYEGELQCRQRRIAELEDELEEARSILYEDDDFDDDEYYYDSYGKMHRKRHRRKHDDDDFWDDDDDDDEWDVIGYE